MSNYKTLLGTGVNRVMCHLWFAPESRRPTTGTHVEDLLLAPEEEEQWGSAGGECGVWEGGGRQHEGCKEATDGCTESKHLHSKTLISTCSEEESGRGAERRLGLCNGGDC